MNRNAPKRKYPDISKDLAPIAEKLERNSQGLGGPNGNSPELNKHVRDILNHTASDLSCDKIESMVKFTQDVMNNQLDKSENTIWDRLGRE